MLGQTKDALQDLVVVVSLVKTLGDSFGSASDLYKKLKKKSRSVKDVAEDVKDHIKEDIKEEIDEFRDHGRRRRRDSHPDEERTLRLRSRSRSRRRRSHSRDSDEESIDSSHNLVRAEYDRGYHYLGEKYAVGDLTTCNQLQFQIIGLQQALLYIYEDVLLGTHTPRYPPAVHLRQLVQKTRAARSASIDALAMQYKRMLPAPEVHDLQPSLPKALPASPVVDSTREIVIRRGRSNTARSIGPDSDTSASNRSVKGTTKPSSRDLYCVYARDLQRNHALPLADCFKPGGDNCCPFCHTHIPARMNKAWEIVKEDDIRKGTERIFLVGTRFIVKCHRDGGGYACALCSEHSNADTVCSEVRALVEHLWKDHSSVELELDDNIGEKK